MLKIKNLQFSYLDKQIIKNLNLEMLSTDKILINGDSGSGKTTFLKLIYGKLKSLDSIYLHNKKIEKYSEIERYNLIGFIKQNPDEQIVSATVENELRFGMEIRGFSEEKIQINLKKYLKFCGLENAQNLSTQSLSSGQKQKLIISSFLAIEPKLLLFDEPFAHLDQESAKDLQSFLQNISIPIILIEHRTELFEKIATKKLTLENGTLISFKEEVRSFKKVNSTINYKNKLLSVKNIHFSVNGNPILQNISFNLFEGEKIAITGNNGSGKTTLLQILAGALEPTQGKIEKLFSSAILFDKPDHSLIQVSVKKQIQNTHFIKFLDLEKNKNDHPLTLSKGQRFRTAIASLLKSRSKILILDEPTTGQDFENLSKILDLLHDRTIIFSSHDKQFINAIATRTYKI
jgi:energy-coupling factor transport system ATP-binding protein